MYITLVAQTVKNLPGSIPESGRSPGEGTGHPLQYPCQENPRDWGAYSPWGRKELDTTEGLTLWMINFIIQQKLTQHWEAIISQLKNK